MSISKGESPRIIFIGTPEFGATILNGLITGGYKPVLVITAPDKPAGRKQVITPPPVKVLAEKHNISMLQPKQILNSKSEILNSKSDLIILAAYGQLLPKEILGIPKYGCLNIHPSLLPEYRGSSPIQYAILNGDSKTGVTIIKMTEKIDTGPIVASKELKIEEKETSGTLHNKLAELGVDLLIKTIPRWIEGKIKAKPQDESEATYTKVLRKEGGKINWRESATLIERQVRAFEPWPGSWANWLILREKMLKIKILKSRVYIPQNKIKLKIYPPGKTLVVPQNEIGVQCGKGFLVIEEIQLEGKKPVTSEEFLRGHPDFIGTILK